MPSLASKVRSLARSTTTIERASPRRTIDKEDLAGAFERPRRSFLRCFFEQEEHPIYKGSRANNKMTTVYRHSVDCPAWAHNEISFEALLFGFTTASF